MTQSSDRARNDSLDVVAPWIWSSQLGLMIDGTCRVENLQVIEVDL